jgi:hypothetical protein
MDLRDFNLVNRSKHYAAIQVNNTFDIYSQEDKASGLRYYVVRNVMKNPDAFIDLLQSHNAYGGDVEISTPGYRQLISPMELPTLCNLYTQFYKQFTKKDLPQPISSWCFATNIYHDQMVCWNNNNMPHYDRQPITAYLWLTKNMDAGTGFYSLKIGDKIHYRYTDEFNKMSKEEYLKYFKYDMATATKKEWKRFESDEHWQVYAVTPSEFNSVVFYDPMYFHNAFYDKSDARVRYSLLSFLDQPAKTKPFWL